MNFMEAVQAMKEGKKVGLESARNWYMVKNGNTYSRHNRSDGDNTKLTQHFNDWEFEATDWVVVDGDENWNLAEHETLSEDLFRKPDVKKLRDLIIGDVAQEKTEECLDFLFTKIRRIIEKRFGDLK